MHSRKRLELLISAYVESKSQKAPTRSLKRQIPRDRSCFLMRSVSCDIDAVLPTH